MRRAGTATAVLSIDDLYRNKAERIALTREMHPMLVVRGVPGTRAVELGRGIIAALDHGRDARLPRFDRPATIARPKPRRARRRRTRHILAEMPGRADLVIRLDRDRVPLSITSARRSR
jgi:pantothenate kinase-related protein Tda10